jgi:hypothetical protein
VSQLGAGVAAAPPASLKAGVMAQIAGTRQLSPLLPETVVDLATHRRKQQRVVRALSIAAALIVIAVGAFVVGRRSGEGSDFAAAAVVVGDGLPDPGPGKAYELWLIDDSGAHAVRLLDKAEDRQVRRVVDVDGSPTQWAITVEPEAGVDKATGDIIFAGAV